MKKLMIAAAIVCAAAFAQAATINWQSGVIYVAADAAGTTGSGDSYKAGLAASGRMITAYLYELVSDPLEMEGGKTAAQKYAEAQKMDAAALYDTYFGTTPTGTKTSVGNGQANVSQTGVADSSGMHYGVLLFIDDSTSRVPEGKDAFVKAALATVDVGSSGTFSATDLINKTTASTWTAVPVPEPTSGLLLLLGVAGMALRRRRA